MDGFIFPNEMHVTWSVMIVLYPYITGLVAGAFIVSSLYHVFGLEQLRPISRFSLVSAFAFLLFATMPLLNHLGHPERAFNIMITPHFTSAMSGFGFVYAAYSVIVFLEIWFHYRTDIIVRHDAARGPVRLLYRVLLLGVTERSDASDRIDHGLVKALAAIGIPVACILHGYVGFLFGSIKANAWWSTPLMFIIFLFSAIVSGVSVLIFLYQFVHWLRRAKVDQPALDMMTRLLWAFMIVAVVLELMDLLSIAYEQTEEWVILRELIAGKLWYTYVILQIIVCSVVPFLILSVVVLFRPPPRWRNGLVFVCAVLLLLQVLLMRWNVVIGGQLVSKSFRGFTEYLPGLFDREGLVAAAVILIVPFLLLWAFDKVFPFFPNTTRRPRAKAGLPPAPPLT